MHELSVALNIIEIAQEEAARHDAARVLAIHLQLGPQAGVARDALTFAFGLACEGTPLEGCRLLFDEGLDRDLEISRLEIQS